MKDKLCIFVCKNLEPEASYILQSENYSDVKLLSYPSECIGSPLNNEKVAQLIPPDGAYSKTVFFVSSCYSKIRSDLTFNRKVELIELAQCFEFLISKELIGHYISQGYYLTSNGWLKNDHKRIDNLEVNGNSAKTSFRESIKKILFLDTGLPDDYLSNLEKLSGAMGVPYEILPIGLSYARNLIDAEVIKWRTEKERIYLKEEMAQFNKEKADYYLLFNQLHRLVEYHDETKIVNEIIEILNRLFAPDEIGFRRFEGGEEQDAIWFMNENYDFQKNNENFFSIEITYQDEVFGFFEVKIMNFPEYIDRYRKIRPVISTICGVSIANARKYKIIQKQSEQLKDYSLQLKEMIQSKDTFFSIIAHDLRGGLGGLMGIAEIMADESFELTEDEKKEMTFVLSRSSRSLYSLLENILEWSKMQRGLISYEPKILVVSDIISDVSTLLDESITKKAITLIVEVQEELVVFADLHMFQSIIRNLLSNAVKFTSKGGQITISANSGADEMVVIAVKDTGIGMSEAILENIFRIEVNTNRMGTEGEPSSGLGLMLCKDFVEKHGGKIWIESEVGKGATFYFSIRGESPF